MKGSITTIRESLSQEEINGLSELVRFVWEKRDIVKPQNTSINLQNNPIQKLLDKWDAEARKYAEEYGITGTGGDDAVDAYRHAYISAKLTNTVWLVGEYVAGTGGNWLEIFNQYKKGETEEHWILAMNMDLWNNAIGRGIGREALQGSLGEKAIAYLVFEAYKEGKLITNLDDSDIIGRGHPYPLPELANFWQSIQNFYRKFHDIMNYFIFGKPIFGDPLALDLDGDGIETISLSNSNAMFDLDGDKFAEKTGWISKDDGILAIDRNNNGRIDDISEVFGNKNKPNGFETLKEFDTNNDGKINANDTQFNQLKVWQDKLGVRCQVLGVRYQ